MKKNFKAVSVALATLFFSSNIYAWDGSISGKILQLEVTGATNYAVRVTLEGAPTLCSAGFNWAYINEADSNYKVYVAGLMAAKMAGSTVILYTTNTPGTGYCQIGYLTVR